MQLGPRNSRFHARIQIERMFLTPTNHVFGKSAPLLGMSAKAIESWVGRASVTYPSEDVKKVAGMLSAAALRSEILADDSRDTFEPAHARPSGMEHLAQMLVAALSSIKPVTF